MRYLLVAAACLLTAVTADFAHLEATQAPVAKSQAAPARPVQQGQPAAPGAPVASHDPAPAVSSTGNRELLDKFCVGCHNQRSKTAGVMFDTMDLAQVAEHADVWEKTVRKLRAGMMPPPGSRKPETAVLDSFATWLETSLDEAAARNPDPGRVALHRLNRAEYANAIEDLLGVRVDATALLPKDDEAEGFDNLAASLKVSPAFLDQYITAARQVTNRAIGDPAPKPDSTTYRPPRGADQYRRGEGLPPGTRGGFLVEHVFPADGDYKFNIAGLAAAFYMRGIEYQHTVVLTLDGAKIFQGTVGGEADMKAIDQLQAPAVAAVNGRFQNISAKVTSGPHKVGVMFIARSYAESDEVLNAFRPAAGEERIPRIAAVEIVGPFSPQGVGQLPSRNQVMICQPAASATAAEETACATKIFSTLARRAYRRPLNERDLDAPLAFYKQARQAADFETGIKQGVTAILASPKFLFRAEQVAANVKPGSVYRISDLDLASRLAFFLTGRNPDTQLLDTAVAGKLQDPAIVEQQVRRLLADPRSKTLVTSFAFQWLKLRNLDDVDPDSTQFPNFDASLRESFKKEIELFVQSVMREDRSVLDLLTGNYTFANERLALHYGIGNVRGETFQRVTLTDPNRWGLLGKGAVLMATSYGNRTAPVLRGSWILENIVGAPPASPPPDVEGFKENKVGEKAKTVRDIMQQHRTKPTCNACHAVMDPLGFSLENFDAIGAWRTADRWAHEAIDPSGQLVDGTKVSGPVDLRNALMRRPQQFVQTFTEKLLTYALGRALEAHDMPTVRAIVRDASRDNYRFSSIVMGIVKSAPFQMRKSAPAEGLSTKAE